MKKFMLLFTILIFSCQSSHDVEEIKLTKPTMVSIAPDSVAIKKLQEKWGDEEFPVFINDVMWYDSELMMLVDSLDIKQINSEKRKIKLIGGENHWQIDMDTTELKWLYIYFDGTEFLERDAITMRELLSSN
ncbi:hypothetical protein JQC67_08040 [Aurantibacter crassamenti]|uniref:hypothetical protein n=1 Tax=Aurantibacter crassamenti TaxID=1837375 RepID=UPI001939F90D|nr:hypothetical protein [Aurantibacter crassamenti]MBM1106081.1 hypothetical protein [Aurantibacter crassamenti]